MNSGNIPYGDLSNEDLAMSCKNYDNQAAWDEFRVRFDRLYYGRIASHVIRYGQAVVDDLVGEALYKTVRGISRFDPNQPLVAWLTAIIDNVVNDYLRALRRKQSFVQVSTSDARELASLLNSRGLGSEVALETLREILEDIPPDKRRWAQAILAGVSPYRVSQTFGVPKDAIYHLKNKLEDLLREALRRKGSAIDDAPRND